MIVNVRDIFELLHIRAYTKYALLDPTKVNLFLGESTSTSLHTQVKRACTHTHPPNYFILSLSLYLHKGNYGLIYMNLIWIVVFSLII
jgi:hypothetical protein